MTSFLRYPIEFVAMDARQTKFEEGERAAHYN